MLTHKSKDIVNIKGVEKRNLEINYLVYQFR